VHYLILTTAPLYFGVGAKIENFSLWIFTRTIYVMQATDIVPSSSSLHSFDYEMKEAA
jgi:hypothetical protein